MNLSSELNQSCEELRLFGKQELSDNADLGLRYFVLGYNIVLFPFSLSLTGLIIFLVIKFKHLQQTTFFLALQVAIVDFLYTLFFMPTAITSTIGGQWSIGLHTCIISGGVFSFIFQHRNWLMFVFVFDRFCTVFMPFRYDTYRRKVTLLLFLTAIALAVISAVLAMTFSCFGLSRVIWLCISTIDETCPNYELCQQLAILFITIGKIVVPMAMVMYIALFIKAKKVHNQNLIMPSGTQEDAERIKKGSKG